MLLVSGFCRPQINAYGGPQPPPSLLSVVIENDGLRRMLCNLLQTIAIDPRQLWPGSRRVRSLLIPELVPRQTCRTRAGFQFNITDAGLASLSPVTELMTLNLSFCRIMDAGLASLAALTGLTTLDVSCCYIITDAGLASLSPLTGLATLN